MTRKGKEKIAFICRVRKWVDSEGSKGVLKDRYSFFPIWTHSVDDFVLEKEFRKMAVRKGTDVAFNRGEHNLDFEFLGFFKMFENAHLVKITIETIREKDSK